MDDMDTKRSMYRRGKVNNWLQNEDNDFYSKNCTVIEDSNEDNSLINESDESTEFISVSQREANYNFDETLSKKDVKNKKKVYSNSSKPSRKQLKRRQLPILFDNQTKKKRKASKSIVNLRKFVSNIKDVNRSNEINHEFVEETEVNNEIVTNKKDSPDLHFLSPVENLTEVSLFSKSDSDTDWSESKSINLKNSFVKKKMVNKKLKLRSIYDSRKNNYKRNRRHLVALDEEKSNNDSEDSIIILDSDNKAIKPKRMFFNHDRKRRFIFKASSIKQANEISSKCKEIQNQLPAKNYTCKKYETQHNSPENKNDGMQNVKLVDKKPEPNLLIRKIFNRSGNDEIEEHDRNLKYAQFSSISRKHMNFDQLVSRDLTTPMNEHVQFCEIQEENDLIKEDKSGNTIRGNLTKNKNINGLNKDVKPNFLDKVLSFYERRFGLEKYNKTTKDPVLFNDKYDHCNDHNHENFCPKYKFKKQKHRLKQKKNILNKSVTLSPGWSKLKKRLRELNIPLKKSLNVTVNGDLKKDIVNKSNVKNTKQLCKSETKSSIMKLRRSLSMSVLSTYNENQEQFYSLTKNHSKSMNDIYKKNITLHLKMIDPQEMIEWSKLFCVKQSSIGSSKNDELDSNMEESPIIISESESESSSYVLPSQKCENRVFQQQKSSSVTESLGTECYSLDIFQNSCTSSNEIYTSDRDDESIKLTRQTQNDTFFQDFVLPSQEIKQNIIKRYKSKTFKESNNLKFQDKINNGLMAKDDHNSYTNLHHREERSFQVNISISCGNIANDGAVKQSDQNTVQVKERKSNIDKQGNFSDNVKAINLSDTTSSFKMNVNYFY